MELFLAGQREMPIGRISTEDLLKASVEIKGHKAKTRQRRLVPLTPQLRSWLDAGISTGGRFPSQLAAPVESCPGKGRGFPEGD